MASVKAADVERVLARPDPKHRVVLIYGPDQGLVTERAAALARRAVDDPEDAFQLVRLDGAELASDPQRLIDEANTIGLFGGKRAIRVSATGKSLVAAVEPVLRDPPGDALIVLEGGDLPRSHALRVLIERAPAGLAVPCFSDFGRGLEALADTVLAEHGLTINREARALLVSRLGADRQLSRRELEKLALYCVGAGAVSIADVDAIVGDAAAREFDNVVDGAFAGTLGTMDLAMTRLRDSGEHPSVVLGFALRHALALLAAREAMERGLAAEAAVDGIRGLHFLRKAAAQAALRRFSKEQLLRAVTLIDTAIRQTRHNAALADALAARALWNIAVRG